MITRLVWELDLIRAEGTMGPTFGWWLGPTSMMSVGGSYSALAHVAPVSGGQFQATVFGPDTHIWYPDGDLRRMPDQAIVGRFPTPAAARDAAEAALTAWWLTGQTGT